MAKKKSKLTWFHIDLHLHTPGSMDYQSRDASYLDILRRAEARNLDIIAFTDHNTINGYAAMMHEIEQLQYLQQLGRARDEELEQLAEYNRLLDKILVLPGVEFTATFGFHILGIFSPKKTVRELEHLLLSLNVPVQAIEEGNSEVGASSDVLRAYEMIRHAGGIVIAAHANASHGVAMRGMDFGGQTRIAYTQDTNLHALEVTDLDSNRRGSTQRFFNGTKPEYPRRMRCIQGSDSHALETISDRRGKVITLGVGERTTEVLLRDKSFESLKEMFETNDFSRSRAYEGGKANDYVLTARAEGVSIVQSFHESAQRKGGYLYGIVSDVCAFANTNGGTVYVGLDADPKKPVSGVQNAAKAVEELQESIGRMISPELPVEIDTLESSGKNIIRVQVTRGDNRPYAIDEYKIYVRDDNESTLAVRDEIVNLVLQGQGVTPSDTQTVAAVVAPTQEAQPKPKAKPEAENEDDAPKAKVTKSKRRRGRKPPAKTEPTPEVKNVVEDVPAPIEAEAVEDVPPTERHAMPPSKIAPAFTGGSVAATLDLDGVPRAGVEIIGAETRNGTSYYVMRDLRNGNIVHNVTQESARRLWHYAIKQNEGNPVSTDTVIWAQEGDIGLWQSYRRGADVRYDLVKREGDRMRVFYGVSEAGMDGRWQQFLEPDDDTNDES